MAMKNELGKGFFKIGRYNTNCIMWLTLLRINELNYIMKFYTKHVLFCDNKAVDFAEILTKIARFFI